MKLHNDLAKKLLPLLVPAIAAIMFYSFASLIQGLVQLVEITYRAGYAFGSLLERMY
ncbi:hypothetical protein MO973_23345 [Paenibacillus sp. TRM 82003]|nr:hypothetical protein [Paenibacillus sp. TRM 82003]